jgi:hypothetical protein
VGFAAHDPSNLNPLARAEGRAAVLALFVRPRKEACHDIISPLEIGVTTGPIRGSRKIYVESPNFPG